MDTQSPSDTSPDAREIVDVRWARQLRPEELEEIPRRGHGVIAARVAREGTIDGVRVLPAAAVLLRLAASSGSAEAP